MPAPCTPVVRDADEEMSSMMERMRDVMTQTPEF